MRLLITICFFVLPLFLHAQHPLGFLTPAGINKVKQNINRYPLLKQSYLDIKNETDKWIGKEVDVPFPKDPAGGYTHDKHKANYVLMFNSGILYNVTGEVKYANLVKQMLLKYAALNPTLGNHPQATSSSPGRIFWQALNDANWLVYAGMAYDLVQNSFTAAEKNTIVNGAFKPEVDFITKDLESWFNLIHNHAVWACAGVGIVGIATDNKDYVDMALYGSKKDKKSGFLALMDGLFSPDGYYTEGPYYVRYAILPYYVFAYALNNARPGLKIFEHRDRILYKALHAGLQQTNTDGTFFALNDALKEKDYTSNELVTAINIAWEVYGRDNALLYVAGKQNRVLLNPGGAGIAAALMANKLPAHFPYKTLEYGDGAKGNAGGVSFVRTGEGKNLSTLIFKYSSHGLSHGHYDKLNINFYDKGNEILRDYGAVRFIGVEQKYGGRYLPETKSYAAQTIAHNTLVADETSHFGGKESVSEKHHPEKLFSSTANAAVQVVAAKDVHAYPGIALHRTVYSLHLPGNVKLLVDIFNSRSAKEHQYDLPFHYNGHLISTSFPFQPFTKSQESLGTKNGYQHLWKEAEAELKDTLLQFSFLNDRTYYSISSHITGRANVFLTRSGAGDPNFNLRHEPALIIRKKGSDEVFVSVLEVHGKFDPVNEFSTNAYSSVKQIKMLQQDSAYSVAAITVGSNKLVIAQSNDKFQTGLAHQVAGFTWTGPFAVFYNSNKLN